MAVIDRIDPEYGAIVRQVPVIDLTDIPAARAALVAVMAAMGTAPPHPDVERRDVMVPGIGGAPDVLVRLFRPVAAQGVLPALFWIQGGGYVLGAADLDDGFCETTALEQQCLVASVAYRRAPEAPFPAASDDCLAGVNWLFAQAAALDVDPARIVVGGASAGGGAAAATALRLRDAGQYRAVHQLLVYPMLDDRCDTPSGHRVTDAELWNDQSNRLAWQAYLGDAYGGAVSPYAAPARATDLSGLPPATILTGELDLFLDEDLAYASRLIAAGVSTEVHVYPRVHHGFDVHNPLAATSRRFIADRSDALRRAFGPAGAADQ